MHTTLQGKTFETNKQASKQTDATEQQSSEDDAITSYQKTTILRKKSFNIITGVLWPKTEYITSTNPVSSSLANDWKTSQFFPSFETGFSRNSQQSHTYFIYSRLNWPGITLGLLSRHRISSTLLVQFLNQLFIVPNRSLVKTEIEKLPNLVFKNNTKLVEL